MGDFAKGLVEPLARRWSGAMSGAVVCFWLVGIVFYLAGAPPRRIDCSGDDATEAHLVCLMTRHGGFGIGVATALALGIVVMSALLTVWCAPGVLNLLSGAWPDVPLLRWWARRRIAAHHGQRARVVAAMQPTTNNVLEVRRASAASAARRHYPKGSATLQPTRIANVLAAAEQRVAERHGLDMELCWRPLVEVVDQAVRTRLESASSLIVTRAQAVLFAAGLLAWTWLLPAWWARGAYAVCCLLLVRIACRAVAAAVEAYCDAAEDTFLLHRTGLYCALGFPLPTTTQAERSQGRELSRYLAKRSLPPVAFDWTVSPVLPQPSPQPPTTPGGGQT
ncbi:hypothetical protein [Streptomyces sp. NBC_00199]|uniref:hypothetical protein n=1 Tax=Streptomyces sp. NBC_00199 TaxID=2975678 RepID=UPI002252685D|nr:hypothetical protein [Streptomyces sp. NBC_00199]MCX5263338.1 hypothetical protein [Streptomyces sp. NBC_00199]